MKTIREQINDFLDVTGISACSLARESGVDSVNISRVRNGNRKDMASAKADAIRAAMRRINTAAAEKVLDTP